jgi:hypothetical protein
MGSHSLKFPVHAKNIPEPSCIFSAQVLGNPHNYWMLSFPLDFQEKCEVLITGKCSPLQLRTMDFNI